jgi:glycosyltransferase involved in cell wall biosynthesis
VHVIPNGIDTAAFAPAKNDIIPGQPIRVGMAARFSNTKRQNLLIAALALLLKDEGPHAWRLSLAGDGENLSSMRQLAESAGVSDLVEFPGYMGEGALHDWYTGLDFYAHASAGETLSTSLLQAMAMGLPILGSNVAGIKNLLAEGGSCGRLAETQTPEAFASLLREMATNSMEMAAVAGRARVVAEARYSQDAMFKAYSALITEFVVSTGRK